ncbi:MAG TPA: N-acetyl-gamma-glutamyl-phosphate reductase [Longimicrobiaceae bacterium]|nr:N-acetyl-gamma-glutamyl-phosphate reductase [Longimicrobiaceae bacterium]
MNGYSRIAVGVFGATGYAGRELLRLIVGHPCVSLAFATSESEVGQATDNGCTFIHVDDAEVADCDLIFSCLPHGRSGSHVRRARAAGVRVIDLSDEFRVAGTSDVDTAVYGLSELHREEIRGAGLIANPGCYPTGAILALAPAIRAGIVGGPVIIDAASGATGAGRSPKRELLFAEVSENFSAYALGNRHRHLAEMRDQVDRLASGPTPELIFTPHLLPVKRGILSTIYVPLNTTITESAAWEMWTGAYSEEPMIEVVPGRIPSLKDVVGTNRVAIGVAVVDGVSSPLLTVVAAVDNLLKGASGQAVQNMNLMFGWDERLGLPC